MHDMAAAFMPHGHCYLWLPDVLWMHVISDAVIALAYFSIPFSILFFAWRRRDLKFPLLYVGFGLFILACGAGHVLDIVTVWNPIYRIQGVQKAFTAVLSVATAVAIWPLMPKLLRIPSNGQMRTMDGQLRESYEKYDLLLRGSGVGLYEWSDVDDPKSVVWSDRLYELYGLDPKTQTPGLPVVLDHIHPEDRQALVEDIARTLKDGAGKTVEYRMMVNGHYRWFRSRRIAKRNAAGKPLYMIGSVEDIHEHRRNEQFLLDMNHALEEEVGRRTKELEQANEMKNRFLSNMSHEIRTPLGLVLGFAELLSGNPSLDAESREYVGLIVKNGEILSRVVNDLLDLTRVEAGRLKFLHTPVTLRTMFDEVRQTFQEKADGKGLAFKFECAIPAAETAIVDEIRVKQIIYNLLSNSLKFTPDGSISVRCSKEGETYVVDFVDTGIGVAEEDVPRIFEEFMRTEIADSSRTTGSGLGLRLSKILARAMGGDVELVSSEEGRGSHFRFTFHSRRDGAEHGAGVEPIADREFSGRTVYVLDDNQDNLKLAQVFLEKLGCRVKAMTNPYDFIEITCAEDPELVLLDIMMPEMSGLDVYQVLRERGFSGPIWALTAYALNDDIQQILAHGFDGYIRKPISLNSIRRKLLQEFREKKDEVEA